MVSVMSLPMVFTIFLFTTLLCDAEPTSKDVDIVSLNEHVKKMDASFQELQSHSEAQEQKYSAVLSSVLSQLTQTTEELSRSKNVSEELQEEVERMKEAYNNTMEELKNLQETYIDTTEELKNLKETYNNTMQEMKKFEQFHNRSLIDFEKLKSDVTSLQGDLQSCSRSLSTLGSTVHELNSTQTEVLVSLADIVEQMNVTNSLQLTERPWTHRDTGFEAHLNKTKLFLASSTIVFDEVHHNKGNGYNTTSGYFTAPVSGTYLFWTNIVFTSRNYTTFVFRIITEKYIQGEAYERTNERFGKASTTTSFYLNKGESISIHCNKEVEVQGKVSSAGAVLIN